MVLIKSIIELFFQHLSSWGLVWFGLIFWGSIFNAISTYLFQDTHDLIFIISAYTLGLMLGLLAKFKGWSWIN